MARLAPLLALAALLGAMAPIAPARAQEMRFGVGTSTTRSSPDWKGYFAGDLRELVTRSTTTTVFDRKENPPVRAGGVDFDVSLASPVESEGVARQVTVAGDPAFGVIRVETRSRTANGEVVETAFSFKERQPRPPLAVGPFDGQTIEVPPRERRIRDRPFVFRSLSRTTEIAAILVAPSFEDLIAGRGIHEVREQGARLEEGSLRVLSPDAQVIGYYAGDVRISRNEEFVTPR